MRYKTNPAPKVEMKDGDQFRLDGESQQWTVRAVTENFAALTRLEGGAMHYTVLDWRNGVRGPCNLIGQGYGDGTYSPQECARMLAEFEADDLEVSHRDWVLIDLEPALIVPRTGGDRA